MKKIIVLLLALLTAVSLIGCDKGLENVVDYTIVNDPYNTILAFYSNPADYQGQNVKIKALGSVIYNFAQNKIEKHVMLGLDPTGCCNAFYEVRDPNEKYPPNGSTVTYTGTFTENGYIELYDWEGDGRKTPSYELDALSMSADELTAFINQYNSDYATSEHAEKTIRIIGHLTNMSGYIYLLGLDGNGYQTWIIELYDPTGSITFPVLSGNVVNSVEIIGKLSFYYENAIPYPCITVEQINKVECVFS